MKSKGLGVLTALGALLLALVALADHLLRRRGSPDEPTPSPGEQTGDGDVVLLEISRAGRRRAVGKPEIGKSGAIRLVCAGWGCSALGCFGLLIHRFFLN